MERTVSSVVLNYDELCRKLDELISNTPEHYIIPAGISLPADWFVSALGIRAQKLAKFIKAYRYRLLDFLKAHGFCDIKYRKKSYIPARFEQNNKISKAVRIPAAVLLLKSI